MKTVLDYLRRLSLSSGLLFFVGANLAVDGSAAVIGLSAPASFTVQPEEDGRIVYLPIAAETENDPTRNLLGLALTITNTSSKEIRLTNIRTVFTYADNALYSVQFSRDLPIGGESALTEYLTPDEAISLSEPSPVSVRIELSFKGYTVPRTYQRNLAPYVPPTADHKYIFPGSASDLGPNEYWSHIARHTGNDQFFAYDLNVQAWDANQQGFSGHKSGTDGSKNEDSIGWGIPVHAMADGIVIHASTGISNNPAPGLRIVQRMGDATAGAIAGISLTRLNEKRAASVQILPSGKLQLQVWDVENRGRQLTPRGVIEGESVEEVAANELSSTRMVTAVRTSTDRLRVIIWDISTDGIPQRQSSNDLAGVKQLSVVRMSDSRFATAVRQMDDSLRLTVWEVASDGSSVSTLCEAMAGTATSISVAALSKSRLVTSLKTSQGYPKVIVWELLEDPSATLDRRGELTGTDQILKATTVKSSGTRLITAVQTTANRLKVLDWLVSDDGESVTNEVEVLGEKIRDVAIAGVFDDQSVMTGVITDQGNYRNILWKPKDGSLNRWGETDAGSIDQLALDALDTGLLLSAVRTEGGALKLIAWYVGSGGGNCVVVLHGNCRVLYAHFKEGTLEPAVAYPGARVTAGQPLGRMGNSGASEGPHCHIHAIRVPDTLTVDEIIELDAQDKLELIGFRPIPFDCARARRLSAIPWDADPATFSTLAGHGVYFESYGIQPTWFRELYVDVHSSCFSPNGNKEPHQVGLLCFGGPFPTVNQGINAACSVNQLFIRTGNYHETVLFNRRMTVRSYDGTAVIGH